jgi:hypothetical protein
VGARAPALLFVYTSAGDTGTAWECREHDGYHLWEDTVLAEHLSTDGNDPVSGDEVGELVATNLDDLAAPLIRYRSDDLVRMSGDVCGCGRTHARMWALADSAELAGLLGGVPAILAHADALPALTTAELRPGLIALLGPALAMECPQRAGAHVNGAEWVVEETGDGLLLSTVAERAHQARRVPLGITGSVVSGSCPCGSADPRVRLA